MAKKIKIKNFSEKSFIATPVGRFLYPSITKPDTGSMGGNKFHNTILFNKEEFAKDPAAKKMIKDLQDFIREVTSDDKATVNSVKHFFKDGDSETKDGDERREEYHGNFFIKATSTYAPNIKGPKKDVELTDEEKEAIKGGDYGRLVLTVKPYNVEGSQGISGYLNIVQFKCTGEALGGAGNEEAEALLEDLDIDVEDIEVEEEDATEPQEEVEDVKPKKKSKAKSKAKASEEKTENMMDLFADA